MTDTILDTKIVPVGPGGILGKILRIAVLVSTAGFIFPNVLLEGMDMNGLHKKHTQDPAR